MQNLQIIQFYSENSNFFNIIFLVAISLIMLLVFAYWILSYQAYIKAKDNTIDPHLIAELKSPSKIIFTLILSLLSGFFYLFLQFTLANHTENLSSLKYLIFKENLVLLSNSKDISHNMDANIPLKDIEMVYVNDFKFSQYKNLERKYCQISLKIKEEKNKNSIYKEIDNSFTFTIPEKNLINKSPCLEVAKLITHTINRHKQDYKMTKIGLIKTDERKEIYYTPERESTLKIQYFLRIITKPGSFFFID